MADITNNGLILHAIHVGARDDVVVTGGCDKNICLVSRFFHGDHFEAFHRCLQCADRIDLGDPDLGAQCSERLGRTLAHIAVTCNHSDFASDHDIGRALDSVNQRLAAAIQVVKLGLGNGVIHVDGRESQFAFLRHLIQTQHACGGFLGHALDLGQTCGVPLWIFFELRFDRGKQHSFFFGARAIQHRKVGFGFGAEVQQQRCIATVVQNHVGLLVTWPFKNLVRVVPVLHQCFAFLGKNRCAHCCDRGSGMILSRENVARRPTHFGTKCLQCFDQHSCLDRHMQAACDAGAFQRFGFRELFACGHQAGHFCFSDRDFPTTEIGKSDIGDDVIREFLFDCVHSV